MKNFRTYFFLFLFIVFGSLILFLKDNKEKKTDNKKKANNFSEVLHKKENLLDSLLNNVLTTLHDTAKQIDFNYDYFRKIYEANEIAIIVSQNDSAIFLVNQRCSR